MPAIHWCACTPFAWLTWQVEGEVEGEIEGEVEGGNERMGVQSRSHEVRVCGPWLTSRDVLALSGSLRSGKLGFVCWATGTGIGAAEPGAGACVRVGGLGGLLGQVWMGS